MIGRSVLLGLKRKTESVAIPALGGTVMLQELSLAEQHDFYLAGAEADGSFSSKKMRALCIIAAAVDDKGKRLFTYDELPQVLEMPASVIAPLGDAAIRICGFGQDVATTDELAKN
jgi:hypothetical protein